MDGDMDVFFAHEKGAASSIDLKWELKVSNKDKVKKVLLLLQYSVGDGSSR
jgi:hypothetical protein